jgi:RimJ/RimL family protein N-acetyltransferase
MPLAERHSLELYELIQENCSHLTAHGDYEDLVAAPLASITAKLKLPTSNDLRFGIFVGRQLVGSMELVPVAPPRYGLGYWLGESFTGKGYATAALQALMEFARTELKATDVFAGVTHGNWRSRAVLERVGFSAVEAFEKYQRFHRGLALGP